LGLVFGSELASQLFNKTVAFSFDFDGGVKKGDGYLSCKIIYKSRCVSLHLNVI